MNATRQHSDIILKGAVVRSDSIDEAADLAASIYVIQNYGRTADEQDDLPDGVTADHVSRAIARHKARRDINRAGITAHIGVLSTPLPHPRICAIDGCGNQCLGLVCYECEEGIEAAARIPPPPGRISFRLAVILVVLVLALVALAVVRP